MRPTQKAMQTAKFSMTVGGGAATSYDGYGVILFTPSNGGGIPSAYYSSNSGCFCLDSTNYNNTKFTAPIDLSTSVTGTSFSALSTGNTNTNAVSSFTGKAYSTCAFPSAPDCTLFKATNGNSSAPMIARSVVAAIRIVCTTSAGDKGGHVVVLVQPNHEATETLSYNTVLNHPNAKVLDIADEIVVPISAILAEELQFPSPAAQDDDPSQTSYIQNNLYTFGQVARTGFGLPGSAISANVGTQQGVSYINSTYAGGACSVIIFLMPSKTTTVSQTFMVEMVNHVEYIGLNASPTTAERPDDVGVDAVISAIQSLPINRAGVNKSTLVDAAAGYIADAFETVSGVYDATPAVVRNVVKSAINSFVRQPEQHYRSNLRVGGYRAIEL